MYKTIVAAALFTAMGSGLALAQGAPPNSAWSSSWSSYLQSQQARAVNPHKFMDADAQSVAKVVGDKAMPAATREHDERSGG